MLWVWHVPRLYEAALRSDAHPCAGAPLPRPRRRRCSGGRWCTAATAGAATALARALRVPDRGPQQRARRAAHGVVAVRGMASTAGRRRCWHVDALADQQLAGLLMWVPAGVIFIVFGLALFAAWLGEAERRVRFGATDAAARTLLGLLAVAIALSDDRVQSERRGSRGPDRRARRAGAGRAGAVRVRRLSCGARDPRGHRDCRGAAGRRGDAAIPGRPPAQYSGQHGPLDPASPGDRSGTAMPELGVGDQQARDIAAYLYSLR